MWESAMSALGEQLVRWAIEIGWQATVNAPEPGEALVELSAGDSRLYVEPAEFQGRELPCIAWLYAYPTMRRVRLVSVGTDDWSIESSDGVPFHQKLDRGAFRQLVDDLRVSVA